MTAPAIATRLLRLSEVRHLTGLSQSSLYAEMQAGRFPRPLKLTRRSVAWRENQIAEWISERVREHSQKVA